METSNLKPLVKETRQQILEAAESRFSRYGYNKTTMAEIAVDTRMSAANIYRYFQNKEDIAAACASRCIQERLDRLHSAIHQPGLSAVGQLLAYVLTTLQVSSEMAMGNEKIHELVGTITTNRKDLIYERIDAENALLAEILTHGNETGEFSINDVIATARSVHTALVIFDVPIFMGLFPYVEFEERAKAVVKLLVAGLKNNT